VYIGESKTSVLGLCRIRKIFIPWLWLLVNQLIIPGVSFIGHLSGLICGVLIRTFVFTEDEKVCGEVSELELNIVF
jgi:membrane associated rhomboid family serine protease